jgi:transposase
MKTKSCKPYSNEIRDKVIKLIKKKKKIVEIAAEMQISKRTILRWKKLEKTGQRYAKTTYSRGKKPRFNEKIIVHILKNNPKIKQKDIVLTYWELTETKISQSSVSKYIKKIKSTPKINDNAVA